MQYIKNLPFMLSSKIKRKMKKTLNLLFLLLAVFAISSCSSYDDEKKRFRQGDNNICFF